MCERWHSLPEAGGILDQPAGLLDRMAIITRTVNTMSAFYSSDNWPKFLEDNPDEAKFVEWVNGMKNG
jgi:hypothetical protein